MEQNTYIKQQPEAERNRATKFLALIGLISVVVLLAWLAFTAIGYIPNLLSALGTTTNTDSEETVTFSTTPLVSTIEHNGTVTLEWEAVPQAGTYAIAYDCTPGVSAVIRTEAYGTQSILCDTFYNVGDTDSLMMTIQSADLETTDLTYIIAFIPDSDPTAQYETVGQITVTNSTLATAPPVQEEEEEENEVVEETDETPSAPTTPSTPVETIPVYEYTYSIPVSDPSGHTDLAISLTSLGMFDSANRFTPAGSLDAGERSAIRFTVKNTGTRTSESWTYKATLPGGRVYESPTQAALRPNETATITLGFIAPQTTGRYNFAVEIDTRRDSNRNNHLLNWTLQVRN